MKKRIIAALAAFSALMAVWGTANATAYNLFEWVQRSSGGTLSSLAFKAGAAQGCPATSSTVSRNQPCYNPTSQWTSDHGVYSAVEAAGAPAWDWNGTTMTETGLFWATSFIGSNPQGTSVVSDRVENVVMTPTTSSVAASTYSCTEGDFLISVGANACPNVNVNTATGNAVLDTQACWNGQTFSGGVCTGALGNAKCVRSVINNLYPATGDDFSLEDGNAPNPTWHTNNDPNQPIVPVPYVVGTSIPRGLDIQTAGQAGAGCAQTSGAFAMNRVVRDDGTVLIIADAPYIGQPPPTVSPAATQPFTCIIFGLGPNDGCPPDLNKASISYMVFVVPGAADTDGDGVPDGLDNCPSTINADQYDLPDGDGIGSACDPDDDNDGIANGPDNCDGLPSGSPYFGPGGIANWAQRDQDGDGIGDLCDTNMDGTGLPNAIDTDDDDDTILDANDNCPLTSNVGQLDTDGDGIGDVCDNCSTLANAFPLTVPNNARGVLDPNVVPGTDVLRNQLDADNDGYGNRCDADLNNSGTTTTGDFSILRAVLNQPYQQSANSPKADLNGSGTVTTGDFTLLRNNLNGTPGPSGLH